MAKEITKKQGNSVEWNVVPNRLHVTIVSPENVLFEAQADSIVVPGEKGRFEILKGHAPIISSLSAGIITCTGDENFEQAVKGGFVEVAQNNVSICVEL